MNPNHTTIVGSMAIASELNAPASGKQLARLAEDLAAPEMNSLTEDEKQRLVTLAIGVMGFSDVPLFDYVESLIASRLSRQMAEDMASMRRLATIDKATRSERDTLPDRMGACLATINELCGDKGTNAGADADLNRPLTTGKYQGPSAPASSDQEPERFDTGAE